jgi:hypothetical protein
MEPLEESKNCEATFDQPPRSAMVNSPDGVGNRLGSRSAATTGR